MRSTLTRRMGCFCLSWLIAAPVFPQVPGAQLPAPVAPQQTQAAAEQLRPTYVLGPSDEISIRASDIEEITDRPIRLDGEGNIEVPLLGKIRAGGLTAAQLEAELAGRLKQYVRNPQVIVSVLRFRNEPVFFVGAFRTPGIYPLQGGRTLLEMLSTVGGVQPNASRRIKITRRKEMGRIPLAKAVDDPEGKSSSVQISLGSLRENVDPAEDIVLKPFDVVSVDRAEMVYVNGEVTRAGAFELGERDSISVTQAIAMAGGLGRDASLKQVRVLRPVLNTSRRAEIPVNLERVLDGKESDFPLLANDVLYIPRSSGGKAALYRALLIAAPVVPTVLYVVLR